MMPRAQGVADADRDVQMYLVRIAGTLGELLGDELTGVYVRGALARGQFRREHNGVELVVVVARKLTPQTREAVAGTLLHLADARPVRGDLDLTIIQEQHARQYAHPLPFEVQYRARWHEPIRRREVDFAVDRVDEGLGADISETREFGVTLVGPPGGALFGAVPSEYTKT